MNNTKKIRVGLIFGGNSSEHDVSKRSAKNIYQSINKNRYQVIPFFMTQQGVVLNPLDSMRVLKGEAKDSDFTNKDVVTDSNSDNILINIQNLTKGHHIDIFFPIIHGNFGEDGTLQGLFKLMNIPYVGSGIKASANAFDKDNTKKLLNEHHIKNTKYVLITPYNYKKWNYQRLSQRLGKLIFIKPANQGSSVGIHQIGNQKELDDGLKDAFQYDYKILAEQAIKGKKEIEVSVIGNEHPIASSPGAVKVPKDDKFYTYQNKFVNASGVRFEIPAKISTKLTDEVKKMSIQTYRALELKGMARIDFLVSKDGVPYVGEANTLPGFTNISLFPQLWKSQGISETKLIDMLIKLGFQEFKHQSKLSHNYIPLK